MKTYKLSPSGRRTAIILLVCALIIWGFAIWSFRSTLGSSDTANAGFFSALRDNIEHGLSISQVVPALLMLVLIVATPLVVWNILEEWAASYTPTDDGLYFETLGVAMTYPWDGITGVQRPDDDPDDPMDELLLKDDYSRQIRNPVVRFLHRQAFGRRRLPIYAGLERRDELLAEIRTRAGLATEADTPAE